MILLLNNLENPMTPVQETLAVSYTDTDFPAGTGPVASITATITGHAEGNSGPTTLTIPPGAQSVSATLLPDNYAFSIQNQDAQGNNLGNAFTGTFTIAAPAEVTLSLASGLAVAA